MALTQLFNKLQTNLADNMLCEVDFFRLAIPADVVAFENLIAQAHVRVFDTIESQLKELIKSFYPKQRLSPEQTTEKIQAHLNGTPLHEYGVWVYYPWLHKVVHMLDEKEFITLRTNRNMYKISPAEKEKMSTARIGVLGLSVGQSVAMALTMERCYGELRIADFDTLDLSNLNRIRSGVQDLGLLKTVSTARQIAEIDPFLKVTCFHEGVTDENINDFLLKDGKLDILIDECDGFNVKILSRQKAKAAGIPVVMETSDRCMLDIERFDLEPERPILHGLIDHMDLDYQRLSGLTMEQKVAYIMPILGSETMSTRIKASMLEIDQTITTWPQLASDVIMGGAVTANVCRRMILGSLTLSGRFFLDLDELISEEKEFLKQKSTVISNTHQPHVEQSIVATSLPHIKSLSEGLLLPLDTVETLVNAAISAPSGGNSQPWKFVYAQQYLWCFIDPSRARSFLDYRGTGSLVAMGAAIENLALKANELGLGIEIKEFPSEDKNVVACVSFQYATSPLPYADLVKTIGTRLTYRKNAARKQISEEILKQIQQAGESLQQLPVRMFTGADDMNSMGKMLAAIDKQLLTNPLGHQGFMSEIRWTDKEAKETADGVDIATVDISKGELAGFSMAKDWKVIQKIVEWNGGSAFEKMAEKSVASASAMGLLTLKGFEPADFFNLGRSLQRLWLLANQLGVALQPMSPITFLFYRWLKGNAEGLTDQNVAVISSIYEDFRKLFHLEEGIYPGFLFRLVVPDGEVVTSLRRPLQDVFEYQQ